MTAAPKLTPAELADLLDTKQVAPLLRVTPAGVRQMVRRKRLTPAGKTPRGEWLFLPRDVAALLTRGMHGTEDEDAGSEVFAAAGIRLGGRPAIHCLRHAWNNALRQVADETVRQSLVGHADEESGRPYAAADASEQRKAVAAVVRLVKRAR